MLTAKQIEKLHQRLLAERARLVGDETTLTPVREPDERAADPMDEAESNVVQHEALGRAAHDRSHLADVERALAKIAAGKYGVSELSGEPIDFARLEAVPWARYTAAEQEELEHAQRK
jgi:RNA polymerase-binding transcription factor